MGRPPKYDPTAAVIALDYAMNYETHGDAVPMVSRLAVLLGVARSTVYLWAKEDPNFSDAVEMILSVQETRLINGGLSGVFTGPITKLLLHSHGHSDRQELDHRSGDGSMTPRSLDDFYAEHGRPTKPKPDAP